MDRRSIGRYGEDIAAIFLQENGLDIIARNFSTRHGEIDIVAIDNGTYVFAEVKYRKKEGMYDPLEAINYRKQRNLVNAAKVFLYCKGLSEYTPVRFDCIGINGSKINWIKDAFLAY